jgi:hypothetical protein
MTANVLRLRRRWEEAEAACSEVLRRDPNSAAAHSLMGDIFRDRGRRRDAIECYKMALDLNPGGIADRKKLEELIDQEFPARRQGMMGRAGAALSRGLNSAAADVGLGSRASFLVLMVGLALAAILIIAVTTALFGRRTAPPVPPGYHQQAGGFAQTPAAGSTTAAGGAEQMRAEPQVTAARRGAAPLMEDLAGQMVAVEEALLARVRQRAAAVDVMAQVLSVQVDPREASALVHMTVPRPWTLTGLRQSIQRVAEEIALAAAGDDRIQVIKVQCDMHQQGRADEMALWAEASGARLAAGRDVLKPGEGLFTVTWWHPELRSTSESEQGRSGG